MVIKRVSIPCTSRTGDLRGGITLHSTALDTSLLQTPPQYGLPPNPRQDVQTFDFNKLPLLRSLAITCTSITDSRKQVTTPQFYCSNSLSIYFPFLIFPARNPPVHDIIANCHMKSHSWSRWRNRLIRHLK